MSAPNAALAIGAASVRSVLAAALWRQDGSMPAYVPRGAAPAARAYSANEIAALRAEHKGRGLSIVQGFSNALPSAPAAR